MTTRELQSYLLRRIQENHSRLHPELVELAWGRTPEEVDASIADLIRRSADIATRARAALSPAPDPGQLDADVRVGFGDPDLNTMSWDDYADFRKAQGIGQSNGHGLFG